jgi:hypothetical protein
MLASLVALVSFFPDRTLGRSIAAGLVPGVAFASCFGSAFLVDRMSNARHTLLPVAVIAFSLAGLFAGLYYLDEFACWLLNTQ